MTKLNTIIRDQKVKVYPSKIVEEQKRKKLAKMQAQLEDNSFSLGKRKVKQQE